MKLIYSLRPTKIFQLLVALLITSIGANAQLSVTATTVTADCPGNGQIIATATGGTPTYQYRLDTVTGANIKPYQPSGTFVSLKAGTYKVVVTDNTTATATTSNIVLTTTYTQMTGLTSSISTVYVGSCAQQQVSLSFTGGKAPFSFALLQGGTTVYGPQSSSTISNVAAGTYIGQITDACGEIRTIPGINVASVDYKWNPLSKTGDNYLIDMNFKFPPAPFDSTKFPFDRSTPYLFTCDSIAFRITNQLTPNSQTQNIQRRIYIKEIATNNIVFDLTYKPSDYAPANAPTVKLKTNTAYRYFFDDLCNDLDSLDRNYNYNCSANWNINGVLGRSDCGKNFLQVARPTNWNTLNRYTNSVDTITIISSSVPGDTLVGKQIVFYSTDRSLNIDTSRTFPNFVGATSGATYSVRFGTVCSTYVKSQTVNKPLFTGSTIFTVNVCKENTAGITLQFNNIPTNISGFIKYSIDSGRVSFTDQYGVVYPITYPIKDSIYYTAGSGNSTIEIRNFPEGKYKISLYNQCNEQAQVYLDVTAANLLRFDAQATEEAICGTNNIRIKIKLTDLNGINSSNNKLVREFWNGSSWTQQASTNFFGSLYTNYITPAAIGNIHNYDFTGTPGIYRFSYLSYNINGTSPVTNKGPVPESCDTLWSQTIQIDGYINPAILTSSKGFICTSGSLGKVIVHGTKGVRPYTFQRLNPDNSVALDNGTDSTFNNLAAGTYNFRIIDACGNGVVMPITVDTLQNPAITPMNGSTYCLGTNTYFTSPAIFDGAMYSWTGPNGYTATTDTIFFSPITAVHFGTYTLTQTIPGCGTIKQVKFTLSDCNVVLPLKLLQFNAVARNEDAWLNWTAISDRENARFEIERSNDGNSNWNKIGSLNVRSIGQNNYSYTDLKPGTGEFFYPLKLVDADGMISYSPIKKVDFSSKGGSVLVYPIPTANKLNVEISGFDMNIIGRIYNTSGQLLKNLKLKNGLNTINDLNLPSGVYQLLISDNVRTQTYKILIQK